MAVNSLGLLDLIQIAAKGLAPQTQYQVYLAESNQSPFGKLEPIAVLKTNPDGAGIVQAIGPLKGLAGNDPPLRVAAVSDRHRMKDSSQVVCGKPGLRATLNRSHNHHEHKHSKWLTGKIEKIVSDRVVSEVVIQTAAGTVTSIITTGSVERIEPQGRRQRLCGN